MGRVAREWRWEARSGWYATINGKRVRLASFAEGRTRAANRLRELLNESESTRPDVPLVVELVIGHLESLARRRTTGQITRQTKDDAARRLAGFVEMHGRKPADSIRPTHIEEWLASKSDWGATSQHDGAGAVRSVFRWALQQSLIDRDPIEGMKKPQRKPKREAIPAPGAAKRALAAILSPELHDLLTFIYATGCRPKEARTMEARHLDRAAGVAVLPTHKTAHKTGKPRVIYLPGPAAEIAYRLADLRPEGPIFLNARGRPWTGNAVGLAVRRLRGRAGLTSEMVAYAFRHGYATDALNGGESASIVAELMGHADLRMLSKYTHLSDKHETLQAAAEKVRGGGHD